MLIITAPGAAKMNPTKDAATAIIEPHLVGPVLSPVAKVQCYELVCHLVQQKACAYAHCNDKNDLQTGNSLPVHQHREGNNQRYQ